MNELIVFPPLRDLLFSSRIPGWARHPVLLVHLIISVTNTPNPPFHPATQVQCTISVCFPSCASSVVFFLYYCCVSRLCHFFFSPLWWLDIYRLTLWCLRYVHGIRQTPVSRGTYVCLICTSKQLRFKALAQGPNLMRFCTEWLKANCLRTVV